MKTCSRGTRVRILVSDYEGHPSRMAGATGTAAQPVGPGSTSWRVRMDGDDTPDRTWIYDLDQLEALVSSSNATARLLQGVRARITEPGSWLQGKLACDSTGEDVIAQSPRAVAWDLVGALHAESGRSPAFDEAWRLLTWRIGELAGAGTTLSVYNDAASHAAVLELLDYCIAVVDEPGARL